MSEQLALLPKPTVVKLTDRQQAVLDALTSAGQDGLEPAEAGAVLHELKAGRWQHGRGERCVYCPRDGLAVLRRLRELGLARYRAGRLKVWQAVASGSASSDEGAKAEPPPDHDGDGAVPYGAFPAGF